MSETQGQSEGGGAGDAAAAAAADVERRARNMGWLPKERFRGDPARWTDAASFVERGEQMLPLVQERNRALDRTVESLKTTVEEQKSTLAALVSSTRRAEKIGYDRAMRELGEKRDTAIQQGDLDAVRRTEKEMRDMGDPPPAPEAPAGGGAAAPGGGAAEAPKMHPIVERWVEQNSWFKTDNIANAAAIAALSQMEKRYPGNSLEENLVEVTAEIQRRFPELFARSSDDRGGEGAGNTRRGDPPAVSRSGGRPPSKPAPHSFDAMPASAKKEYERQKSMMAGKGDPLSKDEYAGYYWEQFAEAAGEEE